MTTTRVQDAVGVALTAMQTADNDPSKAARVAEMDAMIGSLEPAEMREFTYELNSALGINPGCTE